MTLNNLDIPGRDVHHVFRLYVNNVNNVNYVTLSCVLAKVVKRGE